MNCVKLFLRIDVKLRIEAHLGYEERDRKNRNENSENNIPHIIN